MAMHLQLLVLFLGIRVACGARGARRGASGSHMEVACPERVTYNTKGDCVDADTNAKADGCCGAIADCQENLPAVVRPYELLMEQFATTCQVDPSHLSLDPSTGDVKVIDHSPLCSAACVVDIALPAKGELDKFLSGCREVGGESLKQVEVMARYAWALVEAKERCAVETPVTTTSTRAPPVRNNFPCIDNWKAHSTCDSARCLFYQPSHPVCHTMWEHMPYMACNRCCDKFAKDDMFRVKQWFCVADFGCIWAGTTGQIHSVSANCDVTIGFGKTQITISHDNLKKLELAPY